MAIIGVNVFNMCLLQACSVCYYWLQTVRNHKHTVDFAARILIVLFSLIYEHPFNFIVYWCGWITKYCWTTSSLKLNICYKAALSILQAVILTVI